VNGAAVARLVRKDGYLHRVPIALMLAGSVAGLLLLLVPGRATAGIGASLILGLFIALTFYLPMSTVLEERSGRTLPFVLSLPVSPAEYVAAKIVVNLLLFLVPWLAVLGGGILMRGRLPSAQETVPGGYALVLLGGLLVFFCFVLGFALITESTGWTVTLIVASMFLFGNVATQLLPRLPGARTWLEGIAAAAGPLYATLGTEAAAAGAILAASFWFQTRKGDFL
jgi:hypothetical protein